MALNDKQLDEILERLLSGEPPDAVLANWPDAEAEAQMAFGEGGFAFRLDEDVVGGGRGQWRNDQPVAVADNAMGCRLDVSAGNGAVTPPDRASIPCLRCMYASSDRARSR